MYRYYDTSFSQFSTQTRRAHGRNLGPPNSQYITPPLLRWQREGYDVYWFVRVT